MRELVFLLEEESAKALLESLLVRLPLHPSITPTFIPFEGKQDLDRRLTKIMRHYYGGLPHVRFLVLRDQDGYPNCTDLKDKLLGKCREAGKAAVTRVRIACTELETIYLADLAAVEKAFRLRGLAKQQDTKNFRDPDRLGSPKQELQILTKGAYRQIEGSRAIGQHLDLTNTRSATFKNLLGGIRRLEQELLALPAA